jgi:putative spermidine/putrescine transport system permease protein
VVLSRGTKIFLWAVAALILFCVYLPLVVVVIGSFNPARTFGWPPQGFSLTWWRAAIDNVSLRHAVLTSLQVAFFAVLISLVLGTMLSFAVARYRWFGREAISFLVVLPITLPGIVTGVALQNAFLKYSVLGLSLGFWTVVIGHATFTIVVVFNNVVARLRRTTTSFEDASMDLGAHTFRTFWHVTLPSVRGALFAGALLAFGLSFDEIIVTQFTAGPAVQTLPIWIYNNFTRPNQAQIVNVVAAALILISIVPVYVTQRLAGDDSGPRSGRRRRRDAGGREDVALTAATAPAAEYPQA